MLQSLASEVTGHWTTDPEVALFSTLLSTAVNRHWQGPLLLGCSHYEVAEQQSVCPPASSATIPWVKTISRVRTHQEQ